MEEKQDYFKVGNKLAPVTSNSFLSYIDPLMGGSPQLYLSAFEEKQEVERSYYRMGHLIHKFCEDRDSFVVASVAKPTEAMGLIADKVIQEIEYNGVEFTRELASDVSIILNYDKRLTLAKRLEKVYDTIQEYVNDYLVRDPSHIYMTENEFQTVKCSTTAVEKHPRAKELLFMQDTDFSNVKVFKEIEIYWSKPFHQDGFIDAIVLLFKAKLDSLIIDFDKKKIIYTDPKTTSQGAYSFSKSFVSYHYYRQQAFYNWAIREFCKQQNIDITGFTWENYNIVIETNGLYQVAVYEITVDWLARGVKEYQELIRRLVEHTATNQWNYSLEEMKNNLVMIIPFEN